MQEITCPECGSAEHYTLKDHRLQCAGCRRKYTPATHRAKLPPHTLRLIAGSFWRMIPASAAAAEQGMNCKTLQKYYDLLRRAITKANQSHAVEQFGASTIDPALFHDIAARMGLGTAVKPLFCLAQGRGKISLLFAGGDSEGEFTGIAPSAILGWVYAQNPEALQSLDLDRTHFLSSAEAKGNAIGRPFWIYAKRGLVKYHGGFRRNFHLFVHEMEFRFNNDNEDAALSWLMEILLDAGN